MGSNVVVRVLMFLERLGQRPDLEVTVSGGIAVLHDGESASDLIKRADAALYEAKRRGRNRMVIAPEPSAAKTFSGISALAGDTSGT